MLKILALCVGFSWDWCSSDTQSQGSILLSIYICDATCSHRCLINCLHRYGAEQASSHNMCEACHGLLLPKQSISQSGGACRVHKRCRWYNRVIGWPSLDAIEFIDTRAPICLAFSMGASSNASGLTQRFCSTRFVCVFSAGEWELSREMPLWIRGEYAAIR